MILSLEVCFIYKEQQSITIFPSTKTPFLAVSVGGLAESDAGGCVGRELGQGFLMKQR